MDGPTKAERPGARGVEAREPDPTVVSAEVRAGDVIDDYLVDEVIGGGAFGVVVRATHRQLGRQVAIKVLKRAFAADDQAAGRFVAEARAVNQIRHPHIVDIYGFGTLPDGRHYYVMDLLRGRSLAEVLGRDERLSYEETLSLLRPLVDALAAAHAQGITHRDLKPENVFIVEGADGRREPKLLDFGVARIPQAIAPEAPGTSVGMVLGTPCYMAPEQALADPVDARTDVFAFGVLAYRMLTGRLPWDGRSLSELVKRQLHGPAPTLSSELVAGLPAHVDAALEWMIRGEASHRCPDVRTALSALEGRTVVPQAAATKVERAVAKPQPEPDRTAARESPALQVPHVAAISAGPHPSASPAGDRPWETESESALPSLTRLAEEESRAERSGSRRLFIVLVVAAVLGGAGYLALKQTPEKPVAVEFIFQGEPREAQIFSSAGEPLGRIPGRIQLAPRELPATVEIRAPGHRPQRRELTQTSAQLQLVTLVPE